LPVSKTQNEDNPEIQATRHRTKTIQRYRQKDTERRQARDTGKKTQNEENPEIQATRHRTKTIQRNRKQDTERRQSRDRGNKTQNEDNPEIQATRHRTKTIQRCLVFLMFPLSLDCAMFCLPSVLIVPLFAF
jgi:capsule polysaccharide export protein KpsE/RkpR